MTTTKEKLDEIDRITGGAGQAVQLGRDQDNFTVALPAGPNSPAMNESADSWDNALDKVLVRLREASNKISRESEAAENEARTEAQTAAKMGKVSPFHAAILAGKTIEEARAEVEGGEPASQEEVARRRDAEAKQRSDRMKEEAAKTAQHQTAAERRAAAREANRDA